MKILPLFSNYFPIVLFSESFPQKFSPKKTPFAFFFFKNQKTQKLLKNKIISCFFLLTVKFSYKFYFLNKMSNFLFSLLFFLSLCLLSIQSLTDSTLVCATEDQSCGLEEEGLPNCCSDFQCVFNGMRGAPGVCRKIGGVCAGYDEECGFEEEGAKKCCYGFKCVWGENSGIGAKGRCSAIA